MSNPEIQIPPSATELLKKYGSRLDALNRAGDDFFYEKVSLDDKDIALNMAHFYGGPGSPQYGIISRSIDSKGTRHEVLFSWFNGNSQTNFLPAGYFVTATAPDTDIQLIHFDDSSYKSADTTEGSIDETNVQQIGELIDEYFKKRQEIAEAAEAKKENERIKRERQGFARMLAETALSKQAYEYAHKQAVEETTTSGQGYAAELSDMDDESIAELINEANRVRSHYDKDIRSNPTLITDIRSFLYENTATPEESK